MDGFETDQSEIEEIGVTTETESQSPDREVGDININIEVVHYVKDVWMKVSNILNYMVSNSPCPIPQS